MIIGRLNFCLICCNYEFNFPIVLIFLNEIVVEQKIRHENLFLKIYFFETHGHLKYFWYLQFNDIRKFISYRFASVLETKFYFPSFWPLNAHCGFIALYSIHDGTTLQVCFLTSIVWCGFTFFIAKESYNFAYGHISIEW